MSDQRKQDDNDKYENDPRFANQHKSTPMMRLLAACIMADVPALIWGPPGVGKTAKLTKFGTAWGFHVETLIGSIRERTDYLGLPVEKDGYTGYLPPEFVKKINAAEKALLLLDEFTTDRDMFKAGLRLVQERFAGDTPLSNGTRVCAIANPPDQAVDGWDIPGPLANRFIHMDWHFDADEWMEGMLDGFASQRVYGLDEMTCKGTESDRARGIGLVLAFQRAFPQYLNPGMPKDEVEAGKAWASSRSWDNLAKVLGYLHADDDAAMLLAVKGAVGNGIAKEFFAWFVTSGMFDPQAVIDDPSIVDWARERPDRLFALIHGIASLVVMRQDKATWEKSTRAFTACANAHKADVALPGVRAILNNMPADAKVPAALRDSFADLFQRTGAWQAAA